MGKDCGNHDHSCSHDKKKWLMILAVFIAVVLIIILIVYLVLRPTKPNFSIHDASVYTFNLSSDPALLSSTFQISLYSTNPNSRVGIYYNSLDVYATYKYQQITLLTALPPSNQGTGDVAIWSPFLQGDAVPIAPFLSNSLAQEESSGVLLLHVRVMGSLRWNVGSWTSGTYRINVDCPAVFSCEAGKANNGYGYYAPTIKFQQVSSCSVSV